MRDDLGSSRLEKLRVAAVILMDVGNEGIPHRLVRDGANLGHQCVVVLLTEILGVHNRYAIISDPNACISPDSRNNVARL